MSLFLKEPFLPAPEYSPACLLGQGDLIDLLNHALGNAAVLISALLSGEIRQSLLFSFISLDLRSSLKNFSIVKILAALRERGVLRLSAII